MSTAMDGPGRKQQKRLSHGSGGRKSKVEELAGWFFLRPLPLCVVSRAVRPCGVFKRHPNGAVEIVLRRRVK